MKFRSLLAIAALVLFAAPACEQVANLGEAQISVTPTAVTLPASGEKSETVALLATREWRVDYKPDWVTLDKTSGKASTVEQLITVSVDPNKGNNREDEILFTIGLAKASLKVVQEGEKGAIEKGDGTLAKPFSVAGAIEYCQSLGADVQSTDNVYIHGIVASVVTTYEASGTYGNATFYIVDNEGDTDQFYVFQTLYLGNKKWTSGNPDIKVNDDVIICGKVVNYKGNTPETVSKGGSFVYSLNGVNEGGNVEPEDPSKVEQITCAQFIEKADPNTTYRLVGKVSSTVNTSYCSFDLNDGTGTVVVWTVNNKDEWKDKVKQGGTVTVRGKYLKYETNGTVKHEMVDAYIEKFEEGAAVDYNASPAKTIAEFIAAADKTTYYKLTGVVSGFNSSYCSMDITDDSGSIYVYSVVNKDEWASKISNGGTVVLAGQYDYYAAKTQHEVVNAYILDFTAGQGGTATGTGTQADPYNADGAIAYVKSIGDKESTEDVYVKGKVSSIKNTFDAEHGTAIFNISDDGTATATQFTAYSVLYLGNRAWEDGDAQIAVGDEVVLCGKVTCYSGTYETSSKKAYIYSINGKTSIEQTPVFGVEKTEISVGASATTATINVKGNVAWTASSSDATVAPEAGTGKGAVTVTFAANESTEAEKTYKVTVSTTADVTTKSIEVVITQGKKSASGDPVVVEVSFASLPSADFPSGSANGKTAGTYTFSGYEFTFNATTKFYWNTDGYVLFGKKDSYILLPSVQGKALTSISFKTGKAASTSVMVGVFNADGSSEVKTAEKLEKQNTDYTWAIEGTVGAQYRIVVTSAHNAQFQTLTLKYE